MSKPENTTLGVLGVNIVTILVMFGVIDPQYANDWQMIIIQVLFFLFAAIASVTWLVARFVYKKTDLPSPFPLRDPAVFGSPNALKGYTGVPMPPQPPASILTSPQVPQSEVQMLPV